MKKPLTQSQLDQISAHLDGELSPSQADQVAARLEHDVEWASAAEQMRRVDTLLDAWDVPPLRRDMTHSILANVRRKRGVPHWVRALVPLGAAALIFVAVAGYHLLAGKAPVAEPIAANGGLPNASAGPSDAALLTGIDSSDHFVVKRLDLLQDYDVLADFDTLSAISAEPSQAEPAGDVSVERQLQLKEKLLNGGPTLLGALRQNVQSWETLTPEQRQVYRERAYAFSEALPQQQQEVLGAWESFLRLSGQQQEQYRQRAKWLKVVLASLPQEQKQALRQMNSGDRARELLRIKAQMQAAGQLPADEPAASQPEQ